VAGLELAVDGFRRYVPGFTQRDADRGAAACLRTASRRALSSGQLTLSRQLLRSALQRCPSLPLRDARCLALLLLQLGARALRAAPRPPAHAARKSERGASGLALPLPPSADRAPEPR
jgi:hypothetical protein